MLALTLPFLRKGQPFEQDLAPECHMIDQGDQFAQHNREHIKVENVVIQCQKSGDQDE